MSKIINETIGLLHSMILSGEKTDGTVSDMVTKSLDELDKLQRVDVELLEKRLNNALLENKKLRERLAEFELDMEPK